MNLNNIELEKKYKWKQLCNTLEIKVTEGNSRKKDIKKLESLCDFTKEGQWFTIHEIYDIPKEIEDGRKDNGGAHNLIYDSLDDQLFAMFFDILDKNPNLPIEIQEEDKENELYKVYLWTSEMKKVTGMVNENFKGGRSEMGKIYIENSVKNILPYETYKENLIKKRNIKNKENIKEDSFMQDYEEYVSKCTNLIFEDIFPNCKQRTDEILYGALGRLEKQRVIFKNRAFMLQFKYPTGEYDEDGKEIFMYAQQYTSGAKETAIIDNVRLAVIKDWNSLLKLNNFLSEDESKIYKFLNNRGKEITNINEIPNYLLPLFNKYFKNKMIEKFGDSAIYFDCAFDCNEILINKQMMDFKYSDSNRKQIITCKSDLTNKKKINQLVTTSLVNTFKKKIEKSKNNNSSQSNKKYDSVRNDFEEIYLMTVEGNIRIDFKKNSNEILKLSPNIKNENKSIINLLDE